MGAGSVLARELRSLQEELANRRRERSAPAAASAEDATAKAGPAPASEAAAAEQHDLRQLLAELVDELAGYIGQAEKNIAAHPAGSVVGALFVGIVIGRLLGRR